METNEKAEVRVQRGARYLDERHPGWASRMNLETLSLLDARLCIIAQATGTTYLEYYDLEDASVYCQHACDHGFCPTDGSDVRALDAAWKATIRAVKG